MVFYFSSTGNSRYVAKSIAKELKICDVDIVKCIEDKRFEYNFEENEVVGIVTPVYFLGIPKNVKAFLREVSIKGNVYLFFVSTYGTTTGQSGSMVGKLLRKKGQSIDAMFSIKMPDTWTPIFDLSDQEKVKVQNDSAEIELREVIDQIKSNVKGDYMKSKSSILTSKILYSTYGYQSKTSHFVLEETCIGCSLCAKRCPDKAIKMKNNKPVWVKDKCVMCLGCLHKCPKFAIQYGSRTKKHGQYFNPNRIV